MNGLVSLAMAIDHLDEAQKSPATSAASIEAHQKKSVSPEPHPHPWDTACAIPKKPSYIDTPRVVSIGIEETPQPTNTSPPPEKINSVEQEPDLTPSDDTPIPPPPSPDQVIEQIQENDVLCGRGGETNNNVGNIRYRELVKHYQAHYLKAKRRDKPKIARCIVDIIRRKNGRFLKKVPGEHTWRDVGNTKAREKTSQALREGAPELRDDGAVVSAKKKNPPAKNYFEEQDFKKRKQSPTQLLGSISSDANLVSPTPSSGSFETYVRSVSSADDDDYSSQQGSFTSMLVMPTPKKLKRGPRLAILKARLQDSQS